MLVEHPIDKPLVHFLEDVGAVHGRLLNARECTAELGEHRVYHWATILVEDVDNLARGRRDQDGGELDDLVLVIRRVPLF